MSSPFRKPVTFILRQPGAYNIDTGLYVDGPSMTVTYDASVQPADLNDYNTAQMTLENYRRNRDVVCVYTNADMPIVRTTPTPHPGTLMQYKGTTYLLFARADFDAMAGPVSHIRYLAIAEAEHGAGEDML